MRSIPFLAPGLVLVAGLVTASCSSGRLTDAGSPGGISSELVDPTLRMDVSEINAHVYGSFVIPVAGGATAILSGPANFPGNPPGGPGTCVDGMWYNSKGKPTAGSIAHPHPHCVTTGTAMTIVLEPISARTRDPGTACGPSGVCDFLYFDHVKGSELNVTFQSAIKSGALSTTGTGTIEAYAIDAATLNGANVRVGTLTIDLTQYTTSGVNLFGDCTIGVDDVQCLPMVITATYTPLALGGVGQAQQVTGFLWWTPATSPYNY